MQPYRHRQVGWKLLAATAVGLVLAAWLAASLSPATRAAAPFLVYGLFGVLAVVALLFATLTVEVDDDAIRIVFGLGIVRKTIAMADVVRCTPITIRVLWGWGVHWTPSGWLYNVGGKAGIRVEMARERAVIIGSDDASALAAAISARCTSRGDTSERHMTASDPSCIFCKIVRGEIPCRQVYEDADVLAFHDIQPQALVHFMLIPKKHVSSMYELGDADAAVMGKIMTMAGRLAREQGANDGFRTIINTGRIGHQEVQHVHVHVLAGGEPLGRMIPRKT